MGKKRHSVWIIGIMVLTILLLVNAAGAASFEYWNETPDGFENRAIIQLYDAPVLSYAAVLQSKLMHKQEEIDKLEKELAIDTGNKLLQSQLMDVRAEFENEKILIDTKIKSYKNNLLNIHYNIKNEIEQNNIEIKILREYTGIFNGFAVEASNENIDKLKNIANIKAVYTDRKVYASLQDSVPLINATEVWQMQNAAGENITGKNVRVAVIDTGIDYNHPDLGRGFGHGYRVIAGWDVFNNDSDPMDDHGHGTHVAGIVAANGSIKGVAPDAKLMAYKVLSAGGWGWWSDVIDGIERAVDPDGNPLTDDGADIISMSLGGWGNPDDPVSQSVDNADAAGVLVVVAAGNSGPYNNSVGSPGTARKALTVGATTKSDEIASFSSRGPVTWANGSIIKPEVVAPGVLINSTITNISTPLGSPTGYRKLSGTSMATPHVSGAAALLLQLHPDWTPEEIKSALITTAVDLNYDVYTQGAGRIDVLKAAGVEALVNQSILSLGIVNTQDELWQVERNINLRNIAGVSKSFNISVVTPYYSGVIASLSQINVSLDSGAGTVFNFSLTVNNSVVSAGNYEGDIIIKSDSNVLIVPFAFIKLPASLNDIYGDYGIDTDGNGLYDYLVIEKQVNVTTAGTYELNGYLYNSSGYRVDSDYNYTTLNAGVQNITLKFNGVSIYRSNSTGNFTVRTNLYGYSSSGLSSSLGTEKIEKLPAEPELPENKDANASVLKPLAVSQQQVGTSIWRWLDSATDITNYYTYTQFERPPARFSDSYSDYGLDTDSNGLYDYLVIDVGLNVSKAGYYRISGSLYNSSGWNIGSAYNYTNLNAGNQTVQLIFNGARIWQSRTNGTFDLRHLYLYNISDWTQLDYRYYAYSTKAYNYTDFRPQAVFMPGIKDYGLDENSNGMYDYLVVEKQVNVSSAGYYEVDSYLYNSSGYYIASVYNYTYLSDGVRNITLSFSGVRIYRSKSEGNFTVYSDLYNYSMPVPVLTPTPSPASENIKEKTPEKPENFPDIERTSAEKDVIEPKLAENQDINISAIKPLAVSQQDVGIAAWRWLDSAIDTTKYYSYTQFERPPARFNDVYSDYGLDPDGNGYYDYLVINVGVNVSKKGYYYVKGSLYDSSGWKIGSASNYTKLKAGNNTLQLRFNGANIWYYRINGTFDLKYLYLYNASGWWDEFDYRYHAYTTKYYTFTDFDYPERPDAYEPDDNYSNATYISTDGTKQTHNFHTPGDRDWMKFNANAGSSYILETSELGLDSDTYMYLYAPDLTEIARDDDSGEGLASRMIWTGNTTDAYYIMVRHFSASVYGRNTHYNISVRVNYTILPNQSAYGIRDIEHQFLSPGTSTNVAVNITSNISQALSLQETIPAGWNLTRISDDADSYKAGTNEWVWFSFGANVTKTVIYRVTMPANASAGTYYINGTISNASGVIAAVWGENAISSDILSYYRCLFDDCNVVSTRELLKAADDWSRDIAPPGFSDPITTVQLLALADEWSRS